MNLNELAAEQRRKRGLDTPPAHVPTPSGGATVLTLDNPRAQRWLDVKLQAQLDTLAAMQPDTGRNHTLNAIAYSFGRFIPRWLDEADTAERLYSAARQAGLDHGETIATIRSGLSKGMTEPRDPPISDEPSSSLADLVHGPVTTHLAAAPDTGTTFDETTGEVTVTDEDLAQRAHARLVHHELVQLRARHDAKRQHTAELAAATFRAPAYTRTLTDELLIPDEPVQYAISDLLPLGGNALLAAQFKAGKTTLVTNLLRSYADGDPFLGRFTVTPGAGRIAIFNYELSPSQYRIWLREAGIVNTDRVAVLHLRGYRLPLTVPSVEDWIVNWLIEQECTTWIADPFARAATGTDENSNTEVGIWLDTFDVIKHRAGISEAILPTHTGRMQQEQGQERARGATRLDDWADVRWLLTKNEDDQRFFRATGRDVDLDEELLTYDPLTRSLRFGGGDRQHVKNRALAQLVLDYINAHPGCGVRDLHAGVHGKKELVDAARHDLVRRHRVRVEDGPNRSQKHYGNELQA